MRSETKSTFGGKNLILLFCFLILITGIFACSGGGNNYVPPPLSDAAQHPTHAAQIIPAQNISTPWSTTMAPTAPSQPSTQTSNPTASPTATSAPTSTETLPPHNLRGKVTDKNGSPLPSAAIKVYSLTSATNRLMRTEAAQTITTTHGNYYLNNLSSGHYEIEVQRSDGRWVYVRDVVIAGNIIDAGQIAVGFYEIRTTHRKSAINHRLEGYSPFFAIEQNNTQVFLGPFQNSPNLLITNSDFTSIQEYTVKADNGSFDQPYDFALNTSNNHLYIALNVSRKIAEVDPAAPQNVLNYYGYSALTQYGLALTCDGGYFYASSNVNTDNKLYKFRLAVNSIEVVWSCNMNSNVSSLDYQNGKFYAFDQRHGVITIFTLGENDIVIEYQGNIDSSINYPQAIKNIGEIVLACPMREPVVNEMIQR